LLVVLGAGGVLGSALVCRAREGGINCLPIYRGAEFDAEKFRLPPVLQKIGPEARATVVNCVVAPKGLPEKDLTKINGHFPRQMSGWCLNRGFRWLQVSTNGVFAGRPEPYGEEDRPDAEDPYGRSKREGETRGPGTICLRCSFVGLRLSDPRGGGGLLSWLLGQSDGVSIPGHTEPPWTGATSLHVADLILRLLGQGDWSPFPILHFAPLGPVSKAKLLEAACEAFHKPCTITPVSNPLEKPKMLASKRFSCLRLPPFASDPAIALRELADWIRKNHNPKEPAMP